MPRYYSGGGSSAGIPSVANALQFGQETAARAQEADLRDERLIGAKDVNALNRKRLENYDEDRAYELKEREEKDLDRNTKRTIQGLAVSKEMVRRSTMSTYPEVRRFLLENKIAPESALPEFAQFMGGEEGGLDESKFTRFKNNFSGFTEKLMLKAAGKAPTNYQLQSLDERKRRNRALESQNDLTRKRLENAEEDKRATRREKMQNQKKKEEFNRIDKTVKTALGTFKGFVPDKSQEGADYNATLNMALEYKKKYPKMTEGQAVDRAVRARSIQNIMGKFPKANPDKGALDFSDNIASTTRKVKQLKNLKAGPDLIERTLQDAGWEPQMIQKILGDAGVTNSRALPVSPLPPGAPPVSNANPTIPNALQMTR